MPEDIMVMDQAVSEAPRVLPQPHARSTYQIVSMVAYLLGVPKKIFEHDYEPPKLDIYERLEKNRHARIIRHLCILRTAIESKFKVINERMVHEYRSLMTIPEVPKDSIEQLAADGIQIIRAKYELVDYIMFINRLISDRINNCREVFPIWLSWQYVRNIFLMPNGLTEKGTKEAAQLYYANKLYYPYQMYMNWKPSDQGNILYNDRKIRAVLFTDGENKRANSTLCPYMDDGDCDYHFCGCAVELKEFRSGKHGNRYPDMRPERQRKKYPWQGSF